MRIEKLRREFDLDVRWSVFPLHPNTPEKGMSLYDLFAGQMDIEAMLSRLKQVSAELELPFGDRRHTYNSRKAQELGKWAEEMGQGEAFHLAAYRAYFVDGQNIASPDVLVSIAAQVDLDPVKAERALEENCYASAVNADWQRAADSGVTAVPTAIYKNRQLVGFQSYEYFRQLIIGASG